MGITVRSGLRAECLSAPVRGITGVGVMAATTAAPDTMDTATTDAPTLAAMDAGMLGVTPAAVTDAAMPVTMLAAATDALTPVAVDSVAAEQSAAADSTVVAEVDPTVAVADIGN